MVAVNFGRLRPDAFLDVSALPELDVIEREDGRLFLGAGVTYDRVVHELRDFAPLVQASRSVGARSFPFSQRMKQAARWPPS